MTRTLRPSPAPIHPLAAVLLSPPQPALEPEAGPWPPEVRLILSALEAGGASVALNRRHDARRSLRVRAAIRFYSDRPDAPPWAIYTRDVTARGLGFITPHRLPLGYGGCVQLPHPRQPRAVLRIDCTLLRCRQTVHGWYEGGLHFNRPQMVFCGPAGTDGGPPVTS